MKCSNCSQPVETVHGNYPFRESGLDNVVLCGIELIKCKHCGNEDPIIPALDDGLSLGRPLRAIGAFCCRIIEEFLFPQGPLRRSKSDAIGRDADIAPALPTSRP